MSDWVAAWVAAAPFAREVDPGERGAVTLLRCASERGQDRNRRGLEETASFRTVNAAAYAIVQKTVGWVLTTVQQNGGAPKTWRPERRRGSPRRQEGAERSAIGERNE